MFPFRSSGLFFRAIKALYMQSLLETMRSRSSCRIRSARRARLTRELIALPVRVLPLLSSSLMSLHSFILMFSVWVGLCSPLFAARADTCFLVLFRRFSFNGLSAGESICNQIRRFQKCNPISYYALFTTAYQLLLSFTRGIAADGNGERGSALKALFGTEIEMNLLG